MLQAIRTIVPKLSNHLLRLDPGALAELRRMEASGPGTPAFWRLAKECGFLDANPAHWMPLVRILAILTPKGQKLAQDRLHDSDRPFGRALCDGGSRDWAQGGGGRPLLSERRLARILALSREQRGPALERLARMLAARRDRTIGIDCVPIANLLLLPDAAATFTLRALARDYYGRLDAGARPEQEQGAV